MAEGKATSTGGIKISPRVIVGLVLGAVALAFIFQNRETVTINLLMFTIKAANWVVLLVIFGAGMAAGWLLSQRRK